MKHRGPITDTAIKAMRLRNRERVRAAIANMGTNWLLHPANSTPRIVRRGEQ